MIERFPFVLSLSKHSQPFFSILPANSFELFLRLVNPKPKTELKAMY
jgi:hypothetical protein